jgi:hypothetical protein
MEMATLVLAAMSGALLAAIGSNPKEEWARPYLDYLKRVLSATPSRPDSPT